MLNRNKHSMQQGFSVVELVIVIAIVGIAMGVALPMYQTWIRNTQIRTAAESIQNGLQLARASAVQRNLPTEFIFTTADPVPGNVTTAVASTAGRNWMVRLFDTSLVSPFIQGRAVTEGSRNVQITNTQGSYQFNSLGRLNTTSTSAFTISVTDPSLTAADARVLEIRIQVSGAIRMCDPKLTLTKPGDPQAC